MMTKVLVYILLFIALISNSAWISAIPLEPFDLEFDVNRNGKPIGEARLSLRQMQDNEWELLSRTEATKGLAGFAGISVQEHSIFRWQEGELKALNYQFDQELGFKSKHRSLHIDADTKDISGTDGDGKYRLSYKAGTLDRNLVILALALDVRTDKKSLSYPIADKRRIDIHHYATAGTENIQTADGEVKALRVERIRKQSDRSTTIWIAPALGYVPVRIRQVEPNGESIEMTIR